MLKSAYANDCISSCDCALLLENQILIYEPLAMFSMILCGASDSPYWIIEIIAKL